MPRKTITNTENTTNSETTKRKVGRPRKVDSTDTVVQSKTVTKKARKPYTRKIKDVEPVVETPAQKVFVTSESVPNFEVTVRVAEVQPDFVVPSVQHNRLVTVLMWLGIVGFAFGAVALGNMLFPVWLEQVKMVGLFR